MKRFFRFFLLLGAMLPGCVTHAPPMQGGYYGPTLGLEDVVSKINQNNEKIYTLWAHEHFQGTFVDRQQDKSQPLSGFGALLYTAPNQMKLTVQNEFTSLFEMGSDGKHFWLWDKQHQVFWWGDFAAMGNIDSSQMPVRPDLVMEILGVRPLDPFLLQTPAPTMRFNNYADAYMIDWQQPAGDHWEVAKEIWYDRQTLLPQKVLLFDALGHVVVWAKLSNYSRMKMQSADQNDWPQVAGRYELSFPYSGSTLSFELSDLTWSYHGRPNDATYRMPDPQTLSQSGVRVNHIDAQDSR